MKLQLALAAASMLATPALMTAQAQTSGIYVSGGYTQFDGSEGAGPSVGGLTARVGASLFNLGVNLGLELEGSFGYKPDSSAKLDNEVGAFIVAKLPLSPQFDLIGRAGVSQIETSFNGQSNGAAYGLGGQFNLSASDGLRFDVTRHDTETRDLNTFSVAYVRSF